MLLTFLTGFGLRDGDVSVCQGVIKGLAPQAEIVDMTHLIQPQNIREAAVVLSRTAFYFPDGTIHLFVVGPGVGAARSGCADRRALFCRAGQRRADTGAATGGAARLAG